jgi:hypothetical protein
MRYCRRLLVYSLGNWELPQISSVLVRIFSPEENQLISLKRGKSNRTEKVRKQISL